MKANDRKQPDKDVQQQPSLTNATQHEMCDLFDRGLDLELTGLFGQSRMVSFTKKLGPLKRR